jgi:ABC-type transport system involved in multi-copper enzyme maturation permease subunit
VRERANGSSAFTLALPVGRARLMSVRIGLCFLEAVALAVIPWGAIFLVGYLGGMPILASQVFFYIVLLVAGGSVLFALAMLISTLVSGGYTAPAAAYAFVIVLTLVPDGWFRRFNPWRLATGDNYLDRSTLLLAGPLPWKGIMASLCVAALMLAASVRIIQKREF